MRDHTKLRVFELVDEVRLDSVHAQRLTAFSLQPKHSVWTVGRYLAQWGFTSQKPARRAFERDPERVRQWLDEEYPAIRSRATREGAELYWGDEMGVRSDHVAGRSYGRRGQTPIILGTGQRFGCNTISAITNRDRLNFMVFRERFKDRVFLNFLTRLVRQVPRKVFLIVDGHPVHRAARVTRWVRAHATRRVTTATMR